MFEKIRIFLEWESLTRHLRQRDYTPTRKAYLQREEVVEFLKSQIEEKHIGNQRIIDIIEKELSYDKSIHYGDYRFETEEISLIEFK